MRGSVRGDITVQGAKGCWGSWGGMCVNQSEGRGADDTASIHRRRGDSAEDSMQMWLLSVHLV